MKISRSILLTFGLMLLLGCGRSSISTCASCGMESKDLSSCPLCYSEVCDSCIHEYEYLREVCENRQETVINELQWNDCVAYSSLESSRCDFCGELCGNETLVKTEKYVICGNCLYTAISEESTEKEIEEIVEKYFLG